eukprot:TRINITY_DN23244_c0_g1_i1.p1 TRINITY_DN23244_c0_g1~~TRINITY_DN23244_c0_g1_i1.p1  ORF type:complete len:294 (+),score=60.45 TRINITY_DN23244_c0_g1_i1:55-936(+)
MSRNSPTLSSSSASSKRERVSYFFRKFKENKDEEAKQMGRKKETTPKRLPQVDREVSKGGAKDLVTQNQQNVRATPQLTLHPTANGRNFSPVVASNYEPLLPPPDKHHNGKVCLVLDLDETLVHSSFRPVPMPDMVLPIDIDGTIYHVYVKKRPFVDEFIRFIEPLFEPVVFTASLSKYADPLLDQLDPGKKYLGRHRLFREHCSHTNGAYVKDLSLLGRELHRICIIDNSPVAYLFQAQNALPCTSWFEDKEDTELRDFMPMLEDMAKSESVYIQLDEFHKQLAKKSCASKG